MSAIRVHLRTVALESRATVRIACRVVALGRTPQKGFARPCALATGGFSEAATGGFRVVRIIN